MNAIPHESRDESWDRADGDDHDDELPGRARRNFGGRWSALLLALILGGIGFYVGVRVEKNQVTGSSSSASSPFAGLAAAVGSSRSGAGARSGLGGTASAFASRFGAAGGGAGGFSALTSGNNAFGTVSSINGKTLYVTETSGDTVKVKLTPATKITKTVPVRRARVYPGDSVVVAGVKGSKGSLSATTVSDSGSGSSTSGSGGSASAASSSSGGGTSAVSSLFSGG